MMTFIKQPLNQNKMTNGEQGAFAKLDTNGSFTQYGLTKREYFAGLAMQGYIATGRAADASECVRCADALLKELDKPKSE